MNRSIDEVLSLNHNAEPLKKRHLCAIFAVLVAKSTLQHSIYVCFGPLLVVRLYQGSSTVLGLVTGVGTLCQLIAIPCAVLSDKVEFLSGLFCIRSLP
ncbi:hypothetical protein GEMRC1_000415 [Eukaryota sp. GEM-RC1]